MTSSTPDKNWNPEVDSSLFRGILDDQKPNDLGFELPVFFLKS
jgi:hypothetical protein